MIGDTLASYYCKIRFNLLDRIEELSLEVYKKASEYALTKGIIIADSKFEFGLDENDVLYLADEVLTPDSSRY